MFVQLDIHYYVGFPSFRDPPYINMVSSKEPDKPVKCLLFTSVAVLVVLTDYIQSINLSSFIFSFYFFPTFSFFVVVVSWFEGLSLQKYQKWMQIHM